MTKVGLYAIGKSTTLESNKSLRQNPNYSASHFEGFASVPRHYLRDAALHFPLLGRSAMSGLFAHVPMRPPVLAAPQRDPRACGLHTLLI